MPDVGLALSTAPYYDLSESKARRILDTVKTAVGSWRDRASQLKLPREEMEMVALAFRLD